MAYCISQFLYASFQTTKKFKCLKFKCLENSFVHLGLGGYQKEHRLLLQSCRHEEMSFLENTAGSDTMGASHICKHGFPPLFFPNCTFMLWHWYQVQITSLLKYFAPFPPMPSSFLTSPLNLITLFRALNIKKQSVYKMMSVLHLG